MLLELDINDFAIADHVRLAFGPGLTAITGETGAGKSIILDALGLLLGDKADATMVRAGAASSRIEGVFQLPDDPAGPLQRLLDEQGIDAEDATLIISREISAGRGRAAARVNGHAVVQATLAEIGGHLVDIHGQTDHVALLHPSSHIDYLDHFAGTVAQRAAFALPVRRLRAIRAELATLDADERERLRLQERLQFEREEIAAAKLQPDEEPALQAELTLLSNAEQLSSLAELAYAALQTGGRTGAAVDALGRATVAVQQLAELDPRLADQATALAVLQEQAADLARELRAYRENVENNPRRLAQIEERLSLLNQLQRKYGRTVPDVIAYGEQVTQQLAALASREGQRERLQSEERELRAELGKRAQALSTAREHGARRLVAAVEAQLGELMLAGARFAIQILRRNAAEGIEAEAAPSLVIDSGFDLRETGVSAGYAFDGSGIDRVEFLVTLNPGEPLRPLAKVASGGETSRLMLALRSVLGEADGVPTLVFDEIEAGLGGRSGAVVGEKLAQLAKHRQVICITHLAQIAARAGTQLVAAKAVAGGRTSTEVRQLSREERVYELAAMLGNVTPATLLSAAELLDQRDEAPRRKKVRTG